MDAYNAGVSYLKESLGTRTKQYDLSKLEAFPEKYHEERKVHLLLGQYYLGQAAKDELEQLLTNLNVLE